MQDVVTIRLYEYMDTNTLNNGKRVEKNVEISWKIECKQEFKKKIRV